MKRTTIVATLRSFCISGSGGVYNVWSYRLRFLHCCLLLLGVLLLAAGPAPAHAIHVKAGDILVVDQIGGTNGLGALFLVNPKTGQRTVLSDFGNPAQGPLGNAPGSVAVAAGWQIFVSDLFAGGPAFGGALFGVDPDTGNRTLLSDFGQGDIQGVLYFGLAVDAKGRVIANLDRLEPPPFHFAVVRIRPQTDARVLVSDLNNPAQGRILSAFITDLTLEDSGKILIGTDGGSFEEPDAAIFRVNPVTGRRRLLSDFANPAQGADVGDLHFSTGLAVEASGKILVASGGSVVAPRNLLFVIHPKTGQRTVLSDFDNPGQGPLGIGLRGVAVEKSGKIIGGAAKSGFYSLFRVNPKTGRRALLSDSDNSAQGPSFSGLSYIAVVPVVPKDRHADGHQKGSDAEGND